MTVEIQVVTLKELKEFCQSLNDQDLERLQSACMDEVLERLIASDPPIDELLEEMLKDDPFKCHCPPAN
jgi:hypothetical protein